MGIHSGLLGPWSKWELRHAKTVTGAGLGGGVGILQGSLAGVVDLDLQVDGLKHTTHPGLQPIQLGGFAFQGPLVLLIGAFQL